MKICLFSCLDNCEAGQAHRGGLHLWFQPLPHLPSPRGDPLPSKCLPRVTHGIGIYIPHFDPLCKQIGKLRPMARSRAPIQGLSIAMFQMAGDSCPRHPEPADGPRSWPGKVGAQVTWPC